MEVRYSYSPFFPASVAWPLSTCLQKLLSLLYERESRAEDAE